MQTIRFEKYLETFYSASPFFPTLPVGEHFRDFLSCADPEVYQVDEVKWTVSVGATCLETGHSFFTVHPDSVRQMVGVI